MIQQKIWKDTMIQKMLDEGYTHALHLSYNRPSWTIPLGKRALSILHGAIDRCLLGKYFYKLPSEERTGAIFCFENASHLHVHSLWRIRPEHRLKFEAMFPQKKRSKLWRKITILGSHNLDILIEGSPEGDPVSAISYALKEQHVASAADTIVWSAEFHN